MQGFLELVVKGLVDHADEVRVTPIEKPGLTVYQVALHPDDMGKVIGKQGATIHALRSLLQVACARKGIRGHLELLDEGQPQREPRESREPEGQRDPAG